jgi:hypothetical protein
MAAIRTLVEFVKREYLFRDDTVMKGGRKSFGLSSYRLLLKALLYADQIDVEVLLMLRSDVFAKVDCAFYALHILRVLLAQLKEENQNLEYYKKRIEMKNWDQEVWQSYYQIGLIYLKTNKDLKKTKYVKRRKCKKEERFKQE